MMRVREAARTARRAWAAALALLLATAAVVAQPMSRRATTIPAIKAFPAFYNGTSVLLRAEIRQDGQRASLAAGEDVIPAFIRSDVSGSGTLEVRAEVWDIGRLAPEDSRFAGKDLRSLLGVEPATSWPRPGELVIVNVTSATPAAPLTAPSLRNVVLAPDRYADQRVTIQGQFRGRNLFGDQPQAPPGGDGRKEFVLRSADATVWVTGKPPKGRGFVFDVNSRLDTRRWLEVSGVVKEERGLVWLVAEELKETSPEAEKAPETIVSAAPIPPEVLFSAPTNDETDVPLNTKVRVQFSRDINADTLKGHVRIAYSGAQATERGEPQAPGLQARLNYNRGTRVLEIVFSEPLERFRTITIQLGEDIIGTDGQPLKPFTLTFTLGG
jgi:hypothetical protein